MIGVFDSGLGGLTVLKEYTKELGDYDYVYLGDSARAPYGNKSQELIYEHTVEAVDFLFKKGCELVIVACNTSSAKALRKVQQEWLPENYPNKKVLGVIIPIAETVSELTNKGEKIGLIGTEATINSGTYEAEIKKLNPDLKIIAKPTPLLVPLVEEGWLKRKETKMILRYYLRPLKREKIDYLILGCTHYPVLLNLIRNIADKRCEVINPPAHITSKLKLYLKNHPEIEKKLPRNKKRIFYTTDDPKKFKTLSKKFWQDGIGEIKKTNLS